MNRQLLVPDMGDFEEVEVIEVLVKVADKIKKNDSIVTLESDKSSVEVPSTHEGTVESVNVKVGDKVSKGHLLVTLKSESQTEKISEKTKNALMGLVFITIMYFCTIMMFILDGAPFH